MLQTGKVNVPDRVFLRALLSRLWGTCQALVRFEADGIGKRSVTRAAVGAESGE
jgi:hypothetical protein